MKQADGLKVTFHKRRHRRSKAEMETGRSKMMLAVLSIIRGAPDLDPDPAGYPVDLVDLVWIRIRPDPASPDLVRIRIRPDPTLDPAGSKSFIHRLPCNA